jgi:outer membrane lipoprotein-sorting protein
MLQAARLSALSAVCTLIASLPLPPVYATQQSEEAGTKLLSKVDEAHTKAKTLSCDFEIVDQEAGKPERKLSMTFRVKGPKCQFEFTSPEDMKGTKALILGPAQAYIYLPAFGKVRRITSPTRDRGFLGLTFGIEDYFFNIFSDQYSAAVASESGDEAKLLLTPKPGQGAPYAKIEMTVSKDKGVATLLKLYDEKGILIKTETRSDYDIQGGILFPTQIRMADNTTEGRSSTMVRKSLKVNEDLSDDLFTKRELQK